MNSDLRWLAENVHECLSYNPIEGSFIWKFRPLSHFKTEHSHKSWNTRFAHKLAGNKTLHKDNPYISIRIKGRSYKAHRLAILMTYGFMPEEVDHYNGIQFDNRLSNLIPCNRSFNAKKPSNKKI